MKYKVFVVVILIFIIAFVAACTKDNPPQGGWIPKKIEPVISENSPGITSSIGSTIEFVNGVRIESDLVAMHYIEQLPVHSKAPYLIFSARGCDRCDMNIAIYILSPTDKSFKKAAQRTRYDYPGRLFAFGLDKKLIRESRLFIGKCLLERGPIAVWFIKSRSASDSWEDSVYIAEVQGKRLITGYLKSPLPTVEETLSLVRSGQCHEVTGRDLTEEP